jgi:diguanylate cyclase (GGDEF)-like protein/PAS domain S-box-containing protein
MYHLFVEILLLILIIFLLLKLKKNTKEKNLIFQKLYSTKNIGKIGVWENNLENNTLYWSEEIYNIFELDSNKVKPSYEKFLNTIHPDDRQVVSSAYENSLKSKQEYEIIYRLLFSGGRIKYIEEQCNTSFDENGKPLISRRTVIDISDEKEYENKLKETLIEQENILSLFDKSDIVLFRWNNDKEWSVNHVSSNIYNLLGYTKKEFLDNEIQYLNCIHKDDLSKVLEEVQKAQNSSDSFFKHEPYRIVSKDGKEKWVLDCTVIGRDQDNNITHFLGYIIDITNLKELQEELYLFKQVVENIDIGITIADATINNTPLIYVNPMFEKTTGYKKEELLGNNCKLLQGKDTQEDSRKKIKIALLNQDHCEVTLRNYTKDGKLFWNLLNITPLFDSKNKIKYFIGAQHNITKEKQIMEQLENLIDLQDNIILLSDGKNITFANQKFNKFFAYEKIEDFKNKNKSICDMFIENERFFHLGKIEDKTNWINEILKLKDNENIVAMIGKDLQTYTFSVHVNKFDENLFILTFADITRTMTKYLNLKEKTIRDQLTNAYNREFFEQQHKTFIENFHKNGSKLAVAFLDIDYFKNVNDQYGHHIGDYALKEIVHIINKFSRNDDILIRWGGEEFIILLKVDSKEGLYKALDHFREAIQNHKLENFDNITDNITVSIGGTLYIDGEDINSTIERADIGVYQAKNNGRNQVVLT